MLFLYADGHLTSYRAVSPPFGTPSLIQSFELRSIKVVALSTSAEELCIVAQPAMPLVYDKGFNTTALCYSIA